MGEGIVKVLRPMCPAVAREGWSKNLMGKFYRTSTLDVVRSDLLPQFSATESLPTLESETSLEDESSEGERRFRGDEHRRYNALDVNGRNLDDHPSQLVMEQKPLSVAFYRQESGTRLVVGVQTKHGFLRLITKSNRRWDDKHGFPYFYVDVASEFTQYNRHAPLGITGYVLVSFGIALPELWNDHALDDEPKKSYAFITNDWAWYDGKTLSTFMHSDRTTDS